jgi:predicted histidine transporter YuiF (NhaC family)
VVVAVLAVGLDVAAVDALVPVGAAVGDDVQPASAAHAAATVTRRESPCMFRR